MCELTWEIPAAYIKTNIKNAGMSKEILHSASKKMMWQSNAWTQTSPDPVGDCNAHFSFSLSELTRCPWSACCVLLLLLVRVKWRIHAQYRAERHRERWRTALNNYTCKEYVFTKFTLQIAKKENYKEIIQKHFTYFCGNEMFLLN